MEYMNPVVAFTGGQDAGAVAPIELLAWIRAPVENTSENDDAWHEVVVGSGATCSVNVAEALPAKDAPPV
jgi:hypothetical protein